MAAGAGARGHGVGVRGRARRARQARRGRAGQASGRQHGRQAWGARGAWRGRAAWARLVHWLGQFGAHAASLGFDLV